MYNGDQSWTAPETFRELLSPSDIPEKYLPDFRYYKVAINEIPKRQLVKLRSALATVFYIENSTPAEIQRNHRELIELLKAVFAREGALLVDSIVRWMRTAQKIKLKPKPIRRIQELMEVSTMWETAVKRHEQSLLQQGIEQGNLDNAEKMLMLGMTTADIRKITGLSSARIESLRKNRKMAPSARPRSRSALRTSHSALQKTGRRR